MERQPDNTPWALKLQEVTLPDAGEGWKAMAAILDKEMPAERKKRRRWLLLILLLPLAAVSGYLVWRQHGTTSTVSPPRAGNLPVTRGTSPGTLAGTSPGASAGTKPGSSTGTTSGSTPGATPGATLETLPGTTPATTSGRTTLKRTNRTSSGSIRVRTAEPTPGTFVLPADGGGTVPVSVAQRNLRRSDPGKIVPLGSAGPNLRGMRMPHSNDPLKCPPVEKQKASGWVVGIGLNQSIPVDGQQVWTNPSGGLNTWWKDYIPVPFVRYYFLPKLFVQAEVRFHSPQYIPKDLLFQYQYSDSTYSGPVWIKKLFYFQVPVSVHYAPSPDWSIGLGLQYSHYGKGIVGTGDSSLISNYYSYIGPLSNFPMVFVQHNELRGLVSVDYTYRHWIIGMSYDHAFNKALSVRVPDPGATPQAAVLQPTNPFQNSSLQLFVRYILWDGRKY
jgi:hypothetical protein